MEYLTKENLILGCGNPLFGDDGFGPEFIRKLKPRFFYWNKTSSNHHKIGILSAQKEV